jgi:hypothetical protein
MEQSMSRPLLNFRPRPEIAEMIKALAAEDRRPVSQYLANLVEDAITKRKAARKAASEQRSAA